MGFDFVKFVEVDDSFAARATIRQKTGQIGFNSGALNRFKIRDFEYVVLYFDADQRVVGLSLESERVAGAIDIKKSKGNTYVRSKNFLDKYGIDYSESHRHELKQDDETKILYFCLNELAEDDSDDSEESVSTDDDCSDELK
ncbi:hypothetical protein [Gimesia maris]|uniref:hypothetical protein n=1 Tax=Gimesia maris TaxID=122 RepID=UPI003A8DC2F0